MVKMIVPVDFEDKMPLFCDEYNAGVLKVLRLWIKIRTSEYLEYKNEGILRMITDHGTYKFSSTNQGYSIVHRLEFMDDSHEIYSITGKTTPHSEHDVHNQLGLYFRHDIDDGFFDFTCKHYAPANNLKFYDIQAEEGFTLPENLTEEQYFQYSLLKELPMELDTIGRFYDFMRDTNEYVSFVCIRRYIPRQVFTDMIEIVDKLLLDFEWDNVNDFK